MTQLSWRRILERAGDEGPGGNGGTVVNLEDAREGKTQDRGRSNRSRSERSERRPPDNFDFEDELKRTLGRNQYVAQEFVAPARQPRNGPTYPRNAGPGQIRVPQQRNPGLQYPSAKPKRPPAGLQPARQQKAKRSGARNLLAISLSAIVIGFAFYQLGDEWREANGVDSAQEAQDNLNPVAAILSSSPVSRQSDEADAAPIKFRPSLASQTSFEAAAGAPETRAPEKDQSSLLASQPAVTESAVSPVSATETRAALLENTEQSMLKRGHDMIQQGHLSGARLIFEHLADQNSPLGAFALAQTYDSRFLQANKIEGGDADETLAAKWYQRAAELTTSAVSTQ